MDLEAGRQVGRQVWRWAGREVGLEVGRQAGLQVGREGRKGGGEEADAIDSSSRFLTSQWELERKSQECEGHTSVTLICPRKCDQAQKVITVLRKGQQQLVPDGYFTTRTCIILVVFSHMFDPIQQGRSAAERTHRAGFSLITPKFDR